jgi:hypothetical protein
MRTFFRAWGDMLSLKRERKRSKKGRRGVAVNADEAAFFLQPALTFVKQ